MSRIAPARTDNHSRWYPTGKIIGLVLLGPLLGIACRGKTTAQGAAETGTTPEVTLPADRLYILEAWGAPPPDTTVTLAPGAKRTIVLRHGPPDNTVFAELVLPASVLPDSSKDSMTVSLVVRPGAYGVTITASKPFKEGASLRFSYPVHFAAPVAASEKYGSSASFELALAIGHQEEDGRFHLLPSTRPAADNLQATIPGPGVYVVAAPR